jgi:hypothetical protein
VRVAVLPVPLSLRFLSILLVGYLIFSLRGYIGVTE